MQALSEAGTRVLENPPGFLHTLRYIDWRVSGMLSLGDQRKEAIRSILPHPHRCVADSNSSVYERFGRNCFIRSRCG